MNKPIYETIKTYGSNSELSITKRIVRHERVTRNGFSRKKKPISMIKALELKDKINNRVRTDIDNKVDFINDELFLNGQRLNGLKSATINIVQDFTELTSVDLHLYANNHKRRK
ncbi:hypothetical protein [Lactococcus lactis]|uniref:hypothetical protein n=1 Tax=Lactococcus lactis TaxID=1358 RepID=UPI0018AB7E5B|nr:hypothetical protein [Lactococcus lactis]